MTEVFLQAFWDGAAAGKLLVPHCWDCGHRWTPPVEACPRCLSMNVGWQQASGRGVVVAACQFHRAYFNDPDLPLPYTVLLIRLDEGVLLYANPADLLAQPAPGTAVHAVFIRTVSGRTLPRFVPEGARS